MGIRMNLITVSIHASTLIINTSKHHLTIRLYGIWLIRERLTVFACFSEFDFICSSSSAAVERSARSTFDTAGITNQKTELNKFFGNKISAERSVLRVSKT